MFVEKKLLLRHPLRKPQKNATQIAILKAIKETIIS
jgi:hypothetical protein